MIERCIRQGPHFSEPRVLDEGENLTNNEFSAHNRRRDAVDKGHPVFNQALQEVLVALSAHEFAHREAAGETRRLLNRFGVPQDWSGLRLHRRLRMISCEEAHIVS